MNDKTVPSNGVKNLCVLIVLAVAGFAFYYGAGVASAREGKPLRSVWVEVDGQSFGQFANVSDLSDLNIVNSPGEPFSRIVLNREFVASKSLSQWARSVGEGGIKKNDVDLIFKSDGGHVESHYVLKSCTPLSWTVEAFDFANGGFHEYIELAVREIEIR